MKMAPVILLLMLTGAAQGPWMEPLAAPKTTAPPPAAATSRSPSETPPAVPPANVDMPWMPDIESDAAVPPVDPTQPGPRMRATLEMDKSRSAAAALPPIRLRGRTIGGGRPAAAILEVGSAYLLVRQGEQVAIPGLNHPVQVSEVTAERVLLKISEPATKTIVLY